MRCADLFAGIGGFALAAERVPNRTGMLRGAGNAIVWQLAEAIFMAIDAAKREQVT